MEYVVKTFRDAGLEARWTKTRRGQPCIVVRDPNSKIDHMRTQWWLVDQPMFDDMDKHGIMDGFVNHTLLGDMLSVPI